MYYLNLVMVKCRTYQIINQTFFNYLSAELMGAIGGELSTASLGICKKTKNIDNVYYTFLLIFVSLEKQAESVLFQKRWNLVQTTTTKKTVFQLKISNYLAVVLHESNSVRDMSSLRKVSDFFTYFRELFQAICFF